ncbi:MAG: hypothetical protein JW717_02345 [Marinilabiliaceae bacterium]|nr:hypothetical protein [Marinilabiliaceae bacterium]
MKNTILLIGTIILTVFANAQENTKAGIKTITVFEQDFEKGKPDGNEKIDSQTFYNAKGKVIKEINYKGGEVNDTYEYEYNEKGEKIKEIEKNEKGKVVKTSIYKYENGVRVEKIVYDENNVIKTKKMYRYEKF